MAQNKKYMVYDGFHGSSQYRKILTKKQPIRMLRFTSRLPCCTTKGLITKRGRRATSGVVFLRLLHALHILWDDDTLRSVKIWLKCHFERESGRYTTCPPIPD